MYKEIEQYIKKPEKYGHKFNNKALGWDYLSEFVEWSDKRNVKIVFMPSVLMWSETYLVDEVERRFYENFKNIIQNRGWFYIGYPFNYMYKPSYFFNTNFHLIDSARKDNTAKIIDDLSSSSESIFNSK